MRKKQKQEILEALARLGCAHEEIRKELCRAGGGRAQTQKVQNMLNECQEFAISLGETVEKLEGENHETVQNISEYCEAVYESYRELDGGPCGINGSKIYKTLRKKLIQVENSAKSDIRVRYEIVFLPYQASMWDSMESVWMAARDDDRCDAYVIPIPYYERNGDGSLGEMHYDGGGYPNEVPVTDWRTYGIEEQRPDVIYIQNPYDEWNTLTSVHPRFYAKELKKHTDMLVYLPYFIGTNDRVAAHCCTVPGIIYADRVIVQSEETKKNYIDNIREFERENNCKGVFGNLNEKLLPLGSPKLDRIRRVMDSGEIQMPEAWKGKIYKPGGEKKKIIFYNTTIDSLLKHNETYLEKVKSVLALFRQEKEFVLLWRPHPFLAVTIRARRPELYGEYMKIAEEYQKEDWGIYDESADIDRAIVLSDAYYGDKSSVVELYKVTGKPIMIQHVNSSAGSAYKNLLFSCVKTDGERTFAFAGRYNGLFSLTKNKKAEFITGIPDEKKRSKNLYIDMVLWGDFLFLVPGKANEIARVHTKTFEIRKIKINQIEGWNTNERKFTGALLWKEELILLPEKYPAVVRMDLHSEVLSYQYIQEPEFCFKKGYYFNGEAVYLPSVAARFVLKYSLADSRMETIAIPNCGEGIWSLTESGSIKYLVSFPDSRIIRWEEETNQFDTLTNEIPEYSGNGYGSSVIVPCRGKLVVFPIKGNAVLEVDETGRSVKKCYMDWEYEEGKVLAYMAKEQNLLYFYRFSEKEGLYGDACGELLEINADTLAVQHREYELEEVSCMFQALGETAFLERRGISLTEFMEFAKKDIPSQEYTGRRFWCGYEIHKELLDGKT